MLISSKFIELEDNSIEQICVCLQKTSGNIYIFNSYIPPQSSLAVYKGHMDNISYITCGLSLKDSVIVLGDFNLGNINWCWSEDEKGLCHAIYISIVNIFLWITYFL